jgi:hypothetical protein
MSTAGARLSASVAGRRGGKDDKNAKVTGNATAGAANKQPGVGPFNRRQAFSRNKRRSSLSGSAQTDEDGSTPKPPAPNRQPAGASAADALQNSIQGQPEDTKSQLEGLSDAKLSGGADGLNVGDSMADAISQGNAKAEENKKLTAKDLFNNLNRSHESKDKDRKFGAGAGPAGGGGGSGGGTAQPTAPTVSYSAPQMAQSSNIISGGAPQQTTRIVAVPVQVDASSLLGQQNQHRPPENVAQPPISGTEEKAKARAQKYIFDAQQDVDTARDNLDILGHKSGPMEPPHTNPAPESKDEKPEGKS